MPTIFVQFSDISKTGISSVFGCPQDSKLFPNQGTIETDDDRYVAYLESIPDCHKQALPPPTQRLPAKKSQ